MRPVVPVLASLPASAASQSIRRWRVMPRRFVRNSQWRRFRKRAGRAGQRPNQQMLRAPLLVPHRFQRSRGKQSVVRQGVPLPPLSVACLPEERQGWRLTSFFVATVSQMPVLPLPSLQELRTTFRMLLICQLLLPPLFLHQGLAPIRRVPPQHPMQGAALTQGALTQRRSNPETLMSPGKLLRSLPFHWTSHHPTEPQGNAIVAKLRL